MKTYIEITGAKSNEIVQEFVNKENTSIESAFEFYKQKEAEGANFIPFEETLCAYAVCVKYYGLTDLSKENINFHLHREGKRFSDLVNAFKTIKYIIYNK